jgi:pheromone shutdown protein TraB
VERHLNRIAASQETSDTTPLDEVPPPGIGAKLLGLLFPVAILALIAAGFITGGASLSGKMLLHWLFWNGGLAAIATALSGGHPFAILAALVCAPIGTLSPVLSVGVFAGLAQAAVKKPKVSDLETLHQDISSLRGIYSNRLLRILLIFFMASVGGAIGNFIAVPSLFSAITA